MAETQQRQRPALVPARRQQTIELVRAVGSDHFDIDAYHVMDERDNALIVDEILHGAGSSTFVYNFEIQGKQVAGISVIGARHLAAHYKGLKHRIVMSEQKIGSLYIFKTYPAENIPPAVTVQQIAELEGEDDYYSVVAEMLDVKTGNSYQAERRENRYEERRSGGWFERPHYSTIAQSKAFRNLVLALVPQDLVIRWREQMLQLRKTETITGSVLDEKRGHVIRFAAQRALALDRRAVEELTLDQISGLGDAAREGQLPAFVQAAQALGLEVGQDAIEAGAAEEPQDRANAPRRSEATARQSSNQAAAGGTADQRSERGPSSPQTRTPDTTSEGVGPPASPAEDGTDASLAQSPRRRGRVSF